MRSVAYFVFNWVRFRCTVLWRALLYACNYSLNKLVCLCAQLLLGQGGFAAVFRGQWNGRSVAVKKFFIEKTVPDIYECACMCARFTLWRAVLQTPKQLWLIYTSVASPSCVCACVRSRS